MSVWGQIPSKLLTTQLALGSPRVRAAPSNPPSAPYLLWLLFGHFTYLSSVLSSGKKKKSRVETKMWRRRENHLPGLAWRHTANGKEASLQSRRGHTTRSRTAREIRLTGAENSQTSSSCTLHQLKTTLLLLDQILLLPTMWRQTGWKSQDPMWRDSNKRILASWKSPRVLLCYEESGFR